MAGWSGGLSCDRYNRFFFLPLLCICLACGQTGDGDRVERSADADLLPTSGAFRPVDIEPRFPSYIAVPDKQVDAFASGVDTIYRKEQFNLLSVHRPEALTLLDRTTASLDRRSQLALGIACMKIYGGINLEDGIEKANDFIHQVSRKWDMVWPAPDSLGTEFVAMLGKGLGASGQQEGSKIGRAHV